MTTTPCVLCGDAHGYRWTDTHGIGVCNTCGLPHTIFHYEGDGDQRKRVDKPPEPTFNEKGMAIAKAYWSETHRMVFPAHYDCGFFSGESRTYSGASRDDIEAFSNWWEANKARFEQEAAKI